MKKRVFILLSLFIILPVVVYGSANYVNYYGVEISSEEYSNLIELGFTEDEIYYMKVDEFNNNRNNNGKLEATTTRYFVNIIRYDATGKIVNNSEMEITEDDYNAEEIITYGSTTIETTYKRITTTIVSTSSGYRYKVSLIWKTMPAVRSYDIIGIGIDDALVYVSPNSLVFNQTYCISNSCTNTSTINSSNTSETGAGVSFKLPSSTSITSLSSYFYFDVLKDTSSTITTMHAYGDYAHATSTIGGGAAQGFYVNAGGIILSSISDYYDSISTATATWTGSW